MHVNILDGQTDVTERDLGELQKRLAAAMEELGNAETELSNANRRHRSAREEVSKLQASIDGVVTGLRAKAPTDTKWSDERRQRGDRVA